jgi:1-deoxy-D-xylulose-5-phosphate synthase
MTLLYKICLCVLQSIARGLWASDEAELVHMVATAVAHDSGPIAFRYPRGTGTGVEMPDVGEVLEIGKGRIVREGSDVAILSFGAHMSECLKAADLIEAQGVSATVADARFAKPLDRALLRKLVKNHKALITVEQGSLGGFGAMVLQDLAQDGSLDGDIAVRTMTLPDRFIDQAAPDAMYADAGLTATDIAATALQAANVKVKVLSD